MPIGFAVMMIVLGWILSCSTVNLSATAANKIEVLTWVWGCMGTSSNECDRVTLYLLGECEGATEKPIEFCQVTLKEYEREHGLQNERRLTSDEVVEDFRILDQQTSIPACALKFSC